MNYRTIQGIKNLTISFILFLSAFWILTDYPTITNYLLNALDYIENNIIEDSIILNLLNSQWNELIQLFPIPVFEHSLKFNESIFLILGIFALGFLIKGIVEFIYRILIKIRIKNNKIDYTNKIYDHKNRQYNINFELIEDNYDSDELEKIIELYYDEEKIINTKIFFSEKRKDWISYARTYKEKTDHNIVYLKINPTKNQTNARLISGGNFDFNDSSDSGYSLLVSMRFFEKSLLDELASILRDNEFGCFSSNYTIHAHRDSKNPSYYEAKFILKTIVEDISYKLIKIS